MSKNIHSGVIQQTLNWSYEKAMHGGVFATAYDLAGDYLDKCNDAQDAATSLIKWQTAKCATSGFITGCGGLITLPVALPANISSVLYLQLRMIAAIAIIGDYDLKSDQVRSLVFACLTGNAASEILKGIGIKVGQRITKKTIESISSQVIAKINQHVGFRLVTNMGKTGVVNLGKAVPIAGGVINGAIDAVSTKIIGKTAMKLFIPQRKMIILNGNKFIGNE